jgi:hypothetical protein
VATKQKVSANGTYVFDPEDIEQLDELSLTSVLSAVVDGAGPQEVPEPESPNTVAPASLGGTTINELLSGQLEPNDERLRAPAFPPDRSAERVDDLIDPELVFPELTTTKGRNER